MSSPAPGYPAANSPPPQPLPQNTVSYLTPDQAFVQILTAVNSARDDVASLRQEFTSFRNNLPDSYTPRRESESQLREMSAQLAEARGRIGKLEEGQIAQMQRETAANQLLVDRINAAVVQALKDNNTTQVSTQQQVATQRAAIDDRMMGMLQALGIGIVTVVLAYILAHTGIIR